MEYEIKRYVCRFCKGSFDQAENLAKHVQQIHAVRSSNRETRSCQLCGAPSLKPDDYKNHLRYIHGLSHEGQVFSFKSFNDFLMWKNETEKRNYCKFVLKKNPKCFPNKDKLHVYQCDSSKSSSSSKTSSKSVIASKEKCPAMLTAIESAKNRSVKVEYWNSHVGHAVAMEEDELDAAINSLEVNEVVLGDDQRYHSDSSNSYFVLNDNNEASMSESMAEEPTSNRGKRPTQMFLQTKSSESTELPKFSFKKDPSKKVPSFQNSLASVACMKPKPKSVVDETISSVISITGEEKGQEPTYMDANFRVSHPHEIPKGIFGGSKSSANEKMKESNEATELLELPEPNSSVEVSTPTTSTPKKSTPQAPPTKASTGGLSLGSDSVESGQYVILNSTPGPNGAQNLLLCPVSVASQIQYGPGVKRDNPVIFITPSGKILADKENSSSVKKIFSGQGKSNAKSIDKENLGVEKSVLKTISVSATFNKTQAILPAPPKTPNKKNTSQPTVQPAVQNVLLSMPGSSIVASPQIIRTPTVQNIKPLPPGQTFMTIPNNLIPLGNGGTFLAPVTTPVVRAQTPQNKTRATAPNAKSNVRPTTPVVNSLPSMPILLVPGTQGQVLNTTSTLITNPIISQSATSTVPSRQQISSAGVGKQIPIRPVRSLLSSPVTTLSNVPVSSLLLQQRPIISTTVSNTVLRPRLGAPVTTFGGGRMSGVSGSVPSLISQMKQGILSQGSVCRSFTSYAPPTSQKPGSLLLECPSGGVFTLEPVVGNSIRSSSAVSEVSKPVQPNASKDVVKENKKDTSVAEKGQDVCEIIDDDDVIMETEETPTPEDTIVEETEAIEKHIEPKVDSMLKVSPKRSESKESVQIKSVVHEKRPYKDDVEILKKVKYYQLEMKYLSSQAECKRLKLELAKAKIKNDTFENAPGEVYTKMEYDIEDQTLDQPLSTFLNADERLESVVHSVLRSAVDKVSREIDCANQPLKFSDDHFHPTSENTFKDDVNMDVDMVGFKPLVRSVHSVSVEMDTHIPDLNKDIDMSELAKQVVEANDPCTFDCQSQQGTQLCTEPLQSLEEQYGQQCQMDIYTMIRTSVLRNLYDDMKGMCEENKKLFDELQRYRTCDQKEDV